MRSKRGFSLVEVIVVISLMSLLVAMVSFRWTKPYQAAKFRSMVERVVDFDFKARRHTLTTNRPGTLVYQLDSKTIESTRWVGQEEKMLTMELDSTTAINGIATVDGLQSDNGLQFALSPVGATTTYAAHFTAEGQSQWVVFAGRTGQATFLKEYSDVEAIFRQLRLQGADAH